MCLMHVCGQRVARLLMLSRRLVINIRKKAGGKSEANVRMRVI